MTAIDLVDSLKVTKVFGALIARIDQHIRAPIHSYLDGRTDELSVSAKAVKDAVWGMIDLSKSELIVIDSPPLQRLRQIKQLGLTFLTYPTAGYSRFEHTIGAMHQAERMLRAIAVRSPAGPSLMDNLNTVRLAALIHDIGHLPLSHVSERFYSQMECENPDIVDEVSALKNEIVKTWTVRWPRLSECLSVAVALTPSFQLLLGPNGAGYDLNCIATAILAVVGRPASQMQAFLVQIITNVIDADKLDYMFRDAFATGVPLAVDLERLLYKLRCIDTDPTNVPKHLRRLLQEPGGARVLGTDLAGLRHAHDLALSRAMLFERIYHHHKTRAAERVILRLLANLNMHPADLLKEDDRFFSPYASALHPEKNQQFIEMIDRRRLPRRVFALSYGFLLVQAPAAPGEKPNVPEDQREAWRKLECAIKDPVERRQREEEIVSFCTTLAGCLAITADDTSVWFDTAPEAHETPEVDLLIEKPDRTTTTVESFPADAAAFAHNPHAVWYVYSTASKTQTRELIFVAAEIVLFKYCQICLGRPAADHAKISWSAVEQLKRRIEDRDARLFNDARQLRPKSEYLRTVDGQSHLRTLSDRFSQFSVESDGVRVSDRVGKFLDQFPERLVEPMMQVLENLSFYDRSSFGTIFARSLTFGPSTIAVPLSKPPAKSAAHVAYFLRDAAGTNLKILNLDEALQSDSEIVFFDDCLMSGKQSRTVVQTWLGLTKDLDEKLADELSPESKQKLLSKKIRFRFLYATAEGIKNFKELTRDAGLGEDVAACDVTDQSARPLDRILGQNAANLREFLREVGKSILLSTKHTKNPDKWTQDRCEQYALGYSDFEQVVVFAYNVPTTTITALWKSGVFAGSEWLPLFPRRDND